MANMNKVILIGRLTRDVETRAFNTGGMVAKFGFAVTNRKKNSQTGQWEDEPMFIDCEAYNRGDSGKMADFIRDTCRKGSQIMVEGKLHLDQWDDKTSGAKRSKHKLVVDNVQLLDPRQDGGGRPSGGGGGDQEDDYGAPAPRQAPPATGMAGGNRGPGRSSYTPPAQDDGDGPPDGDIPF
jgi:single-strand DNA-binding protein